MKIKKNSKIKSKKIIYTDGPIDEIEFIDDFLPPPEQLVRKEDTLKVTLTLDRETVNFFKSQATMHHGQYQRMIRELLKQYVKKSA